MTTDNVLLLYTGTIYKSTFYKLNKKKSFKFRI